MLPTIAYYTITGSWNDWSFIYGSLRQQMGSNSWMLIPKHGTAKQLDWH